jgi:hypothetical protein
MIDGSTDIVVTLRRGRDDDSARSHGEPACGHDMRALAFGDDHAVLGVSNDALFRQA